MPPAYQSVLLVTGLPLIFAGLLTVADVFASGLRAVPRGRVHVGLARHGDARALAGVRAQQRDLAPDVRDPGRRRAAVRVVVDLRRDLCRALPLAARAVPGRRSCSQRLALRESARRHAEVLIDAGGPRDRGDRGRPDMGESSSSAHGSLPGSGGRAVGGRLRTRRLRRGRPLARAGLPRRRQPLAVHHHGRPRRWRHALLVAARADRRRRRDARRRAATAPPAPARAGALSGGGGSAGRARGRRGDRDPRYGAGLASSGPVRPSSASVRSTSTRRRSTRLGQRVLAAAASAKHIALPIGAARRRARAP